MIIIKKPIYNTQIVNIDGAKPCITRIFKDGQWRQCRIQYYTLHPLVAEPIDEIIYDTNGIPIYVAKNKDTDINYQLVSTDGYMLTDINGVILTTGSWL